MNIMEAIDAIHKQTLIVAQPRRSETMKKADDDIRMVMPDARQA